MHIYMGNTIYVYLGILTIIYIRDISRTTFCINTTNI